MANVQPVPPEYGSITPYLVVPNGEEAIEFYGRAFGARERLRVDGEDGHVGHAELDFDGSVVMLGEVHADWSPTAAMTCLYVQDCDAVFRRAVEAGAEVVRPVEDHFYGDRAGMVRDPFGQLWSIMTHKRDVSPEEMRAHMREH